MGLTDAKARLIQQPLDPVRDLASKGGRGSSYGTTLRLTSGRHNKSTAVYHPLLPST